jgi:hypothetical protein
MMRLGEGAELIANRKNLIASLMSTMSVLEAFDEAVNAAAETATHSFESSAGVIRENTFIIRDLRIFPAYKQRSSGDRGGVAQVFVGRNKGNNIAGRLPLKKFFQAQLLGALIHEPPKEQIES